ncbi:hypothetical protein [Candidatus Pelagibacter sp. HIMB1506]|uniref:hypothetical protein n=1 Tax=Candidatus Pelagibacter sp. HIMB1506 TaxID=3413337 RepID=UPI003F870B9F
MKQLKAFFDKKISVVEFDNQIPKLVENFPSDISVLIKLRIKEDYIEATLTKNPNKNTKERWEWDLNSDAYEDLEDYFQTIN